MALLLPIFVGILCGILAALQARNPFMFILGFFFGLVLAVALSVFITSLVVPAIRSILGGSKKGPQ